MPLSFFSRQLEHVLARVIPRSRPRPSRPQAARLFGLEQLESRALLANITASGVISATPAGSAFDYTIALANSSASTSGIGTFWFAWVPGKDFLATSPISVSPPTGWTDQITHAGPGDGYAIEFVSENSIYNVQPGASLNFSFASADTPASIAGDSMFFPGTPVETSFVYAGAPLVSSPSEQFAVTSAQATSPPVLVSISVSPASPSILPGSTDQFTAIGIYSNQSTQNLTNEVTWSSTDPAIATISPTGLVRGIAAGSFMVVASFDGISGSESFAVSPPLVTLAGVQPAFKRGKVSKLVLTFSGALDAKPARKIGNYHLLIAGANGTFSGKGVKSVRISRVTYSPAISPDSVSVVPAMGVSLTRMIELTVNGNAPSGLKDSLGRFIDANQENQPGGTAIVLLGPSGVVLE